MFCFRRALAVLSAFLLVFAAAAASAQAYTSIVVFGDSLSDVGNDAAVSLSTYGPTAQVPAPATGYTLGRFTDGLDTTPAARTYFGVWIEQLAAQLAATPPIKNSLAGGTDYAYGFATTGTGTTPFTYGPGNALSFPVNNMGLQVSTYLGTNPTITNKTLFVIWGGANDLLQATSTNATQVVTQAVTNEATIIQQLINAGATDFLVVNLPPLGLVPRNNGSTATSIPATQLSQAFDSALAGAVAAIPAANTGKTLHLFQLDTYTLFNTIVGPPIFKGFTNVTAMSQFNATVNPDTYLFWDSLHPTTYGHSLLASAALTAIGTPLVTTTALTSSNTSSNLNSSITLTATVASSSGLPTGTLTFYDGATAIGSSLVYGSSLVATATMSTTALTATSHTLTAQFVGVNGYANSKSAAVTQIVTAPAFTVGLPGTLALTSGSSGTVTLPLTAVGGFTGTVGIACGALPSNFTCSVSPSSVTYPSTVNAATIIIGTGTGTSSLKLPYSGSHTFETALATALFLPGFGYLALVGRTRRRLQTALGRRSLLLLACFLALGAAAGLSGCGGVTPVPSNAAARGAYLVPVVVTVNGVATTYNVSVQVN
jgi:phospholipase/lecithinase/hemolysin